MTEPTPERPSSQVDDSLAALWDATRPIEPSEAVWDAVWNQIDAHLDAPAPDVIPISTVGFQNGRSRVAVALLGLAQAAAVVALMVFGGPIARHPGPIALPGAVAEPVATVEIDPSPGALVLIHAEGSGQPTVVAVELNRRPNALDGNIAMLNTLESMAD